MIAYTNVNPREELVVVYTNGMPRGESLWSCMLSICHEGRVSGRVY